jgi:thiosulfate dehydrogenase
VRRTLAVAALVALPVLAAACTQSGADRGAELFADPRGFSTSSMNPFACNDCHTTDGGDSGPDARILPGYDLRGVAARERFWGGQVLTLADAVDTCLVFFMRAQPLDRDSVDAKALYEYLLSITPAGSPSETLPMTVVENVVDVPRGDAIAGAAVYDRACAYCHGAPHTGAGQILTRRVVLPEIAADYATLFPGVAPSLVFIELIRHGRFFDVGGTMPFFSTEQLTDAQIGDLLAFLEL